MGIKVTVIIPVYNNARGIEQTVHALLAQNFPQENLEIIIADNGSVDDTPDRLSRLPVRVIRQHTPGSPYSARNRALEIAGGEIIAFTDSDCIPDRDWIDNGVALLAREKADLIGGFVAFRFSENPTAAEIYDSLVNLEVEQNVKRKGVAKTGNLFARRSVFDDIGPFQERVRSGGDVEWTGRATRRGCQMVFGADVIVRKEARKSGALLKKMYRVGKGQPAIWRKEGQQTGAIIQTILYDLRPATPRFIHSLIDARGETWQRKRMASLMLSAWACRLSNGAGRMAGFLHRSPPDSPAEKTESLQLSSQAVHDD